MKRTNVVLDEKLLEEARRVTGEKTYSATIMKALEKVVKQSRFRVALAEFEKEAAKGGFFHPDFLAEKRENSMFDEPPQKLSANEMRAPRKKKRNPRRAAR